MRTFRHILFLLVATVFPNLAGILFAGVRTIAPELPLPVSLAEASLSTESSASGLGLLALGKGRVLAVWFSTDRTGACSLASAVFQRDRSAWSDRHLLPLRPGFSPGLDTVCVPTLLAGGRVLAAWEDAGVPGRAMYLISDDEGRHWSPAPSPLLPDEDPSAGYSLSVPLRPPLAFPDGSLLRVFRAGGDGGPADASQVLRPAGEAWREPALLVREGWARALPGAGEVRSVMLPPRAAAAWFTAAGEEPRILLSQTPDAGQRWTADRRCDLGHPVGAPDLLMLRDASLLLCWREEAGEDASQPAGHYLRRLASNGFAIAPAFVLSSTPSEPGSAPRMALLREETGEAVELLLACTISTGLKAVRVTLPTPAELLQVDQSCRCAPSIGAGVQFKADVAGVDSDARMVTLSHGPVPGIFVSGRHTYHCPSPTSLPKHGDKLLVLLQPELGSWNLTSFQILKTP